MHAMMGDAMMTDPKTTGANPPLPRQQQEPQGFTQELDPRPDHGEQPYSGCGKLQGRAALITGSDSGIGRAVAIAFARASADVLISYLCEHEDAEETTLGLKRRDAARSWLPVMCRTPGAAAAWSIAQCRNSGSSTSSSIMPPIR